MATFVSVLASLRAAIHRPAAGTAGLDDASILAWANEELPPLFARLCDDVPAYFEKVTGDIVVADGTNTIVLTSAPVSLTDFSKVRFVELKAGTSYLPLRWAPGIASTTTSGLGATYRVKYLPKAFTIPAVGDTTDLGLPLGMERALIERLAARVRRRFNESPTEAMNAAEAAYKESMAALLRLSGLPQSSADMRNMPSWPRWRFRGPATVELVGGW